MLAKGRSRKLHNSDIYYNDIDGYVCFFWFSFGLPVQSRQKSGTPIAAWSLVQERIRDHGGRGDGGD